MFIFLLLIVLIAHFALGNDIRLPAVAGSFYPGSKDELEEVVTGFIDSADIPDFSDEITALIAPHAGYIYSGPVAGHAYKAVMGKHYDTVVLIGQSHHQRNAKMSVYSGQAYETPLGRLNIDKDIVEKLLVQTELFEFDESAHKEEHSLEVQLPFLQIALDGKFEIVPILFRDFDPVKIGKVAELLSEILNETTKKILFVISTDMSHYHSYKQANNIDEIALDIISSGDYRALEKELMEGSCELCGHSGVDFVLRFAEIEEYNIHFLKYNNSGDTAGTKDKVVGYGAYAFTKGEAMNREDKLYLLKLAKNSINYYLENKKMLDEDAPKSKILLEDGAAFVTLHKNHQLRGCIGQIIATQPLYKCVIEMAVSAAFNDPRFNPVTIDEMDDIDIEISYMTPLRQVDDYKEIIPGKHGVVVDQTVGGRRHSGVYLPQVATETGWGLEEFLSNLCATKAYLPHDAYKKGANLYVFEALVFGEEDMMNGE